MPSGCALIGENGAGKSTLMIIVSGALAAAASLMVMDEPTSSLSEQEVERLFTGIARLRERGVHVIFITHALEELERVVDRHGVHDEPRPAQPPPAAARTSSRPRSATVGHALSGVCPQPARTPGQPVLELSALSGARQLHSGKLDSVALQNPRHLIVEELRRSPAPRPPRCFRRPGPRAR
jgi:ABC-type sugar transport system ATPase subunit